MNEVMPARDAAKMTMAPPQLVRPGQLSLREASMARLRLAPSEEYFFHGVSKDVHIGVSLVLYLMLHQSTIADESSRVLSSTTPPVTLLQFFDRLFDGLESESNVIPPMHCRFVVQDSGPRSCRAASGALIRLPNIPGGAGRGLEVRVSAPTGRGVHLAMSAQQVRGRCTWPRRVSARGSR